MMIVEDYMAEEGASKKGVDRNTPMIRRSNSRAQARILPPIREGSNSIQRMNDVESMESSSPQTVKSNNKRSVTGIAAFKQDTGKRRDLFSV